MINVNSISKSVLICGVVYASSFAVYADEGDYYAGFQLGYGFVDLNDESLAKRTLTTVTSGPSKYTDSSSATFGRIYGGYMFMDNVGLELGYSLHDRYSSYTNSNYELVSIDADATDDVHSFDILGVYSVPVTPDITVNVKAGINYVMNTYKISAKINGEDVGLSLNKSTKNVRPKLALATDYKIYDNIGLGLSYEVTQGKGSPYSASVIGQDVFINSKSDYSPFIQVVSLDVKYIF